MDRPRSDLKCNGVLPASRLRDLAFPVAERLQDSGYITAQFGKWHPGAGPQITDLSRLDVFTTGVEDSWPLLEFFA